MSTVNKFAEDLQAFVVTISNEAYMSRDEHDPGSDVVYEDLETVDRESYLVATV